MGFLPGLSDHLSQFELFGGSRKTATANGTGVNVSDYAGELKIFLSCSAGGGTSPTLDVKLQDSADDSTYADLTGKAYTQVTGTASFQNLAIDTRAVRKFIRAVATIAGTSPTFDFAVVGVGQKQY